VTSNETQSWQRPDGGGPDWSRSPARLFVLLACGLIARPSLAACVSRADPEFRSPIPSVVHDATEALRSVQARIDALVRSRPVDSGRLAELYAAQARSYSALDLDASARQSASKGLAFAPSEGDPVHSDLLITYADNAYEAADIDRVAGSIQSARAAHKGSSSSDICLLITLGRLQLRQDRAADAVASLTQAYRASMTPALAEERVAAASVLSTILRDGGDYRQALALNQEVFDWDSARGASLDLSTSRYLRGCIFSAQRDYGQAMEEYTKARQLSALLNDVQGIAFAEMSSCESQIELGQLVSARRNCQSAAHVFATSHSSTVLKQAQALLARIDLAEGRADRALRSLNQVLDRGGADLAPRQIAPSYFLRARTQSALHDYPSAYQDLNRFVQRNSAENERDRAQQAAVATARLDADREIARNGALERELALTTERLVRRRQELRFTVTIIALGGLLMALLAWMLIANLRYRRELTRLAEQDSLTGLPNRRRTTEKATTALTSAAVKLRPVTIALIDLDHFKGINDNYGHRVGDYVLKEFARLSVSVLRASDTLGRWGGEEFLLILPDTDLDCAVATMHRMRSVTAAMQLPDMARGLQVSFSAGLATRTQAAQSLDEVIAAADVALYEAKNGGRNLVRLDQETYRVAASSVLRALYGAAWRQEQFNAGTDLRAD
jgi:diguanylate cyclase (GGDEF)-like protein